MKKKIVIISFIIFLFDQLLKYNISSSVVYQESIHLIPKFFYLTYVKNTGGAWSIFSNNSYLLIIIGFICLFGLGYYIYKKKKINNLEVIYLSLILGGVTGNFVDRIFQNGVIDYIGFIFGNYYFPVFNLADICIVCGIVLLMSDSLRSD